MDAAVVRKPVISACPLIAVQATPELGGGFRHGSDRA